MTAYVFSNWFLNLLTALFLVYVAKAERHLFIKPSMIVVLTFHLTIQWAATIESPDIETFLPEPAAFVLLIHGFPLIGGALSLLTFRSVSKSVVGRLRDREAFSDAAARRAMLILGITIAGIVASYLTVVPFSATGLYTIFTDPQRAALAREQSLKLLNNQFITYGYMFMAGAFAPQLAVLLGVSAFRQGKSWARRIASGAGIVLLLIAVSLSGARGFSTLLMATVILAILLGGRTQIRVWHLVVGGAVGVVLATLLSIARDDQEFSFQMFWTYLSENTVDRVFHVPMQVGLWHVHYEQTVGFLGIDAIPKLAALGGETPINAPNLIGIHYIPQGLETINANACFVLSYYSYFGLMAFPFCIVGLLVLDFAVLVFARLSDTLLLAGVCSVLIASGTFGSSDYTTVLVTNCFAICLIVAPFLDLISGARFSHKLALKEPAWSLPHTP